MIYAIFGVTLMGVMGVSILWPVFPQIKEIFGIGDVEVAMLITAFTLPGIFLAPVMGMLADRLGRKKVLVPSLFLFAIAGTSCAFADYETMLLLRFLQGVGGSALTALSATIIGDVYEGIERARVLGYNASILAIGVASYPAIGGILAHFDWRYPFLTFAVAIPIGIAVMLMPYPDIRSELPFSAYLTGMRFAINKKILFEFITGGAVFVILYGAFLLHLTFLLVEKFSADRAVVGIVISSVSVFSALFSSKLAFFTKKFGSSGTMMFGFAFYALSMLIIPLIPVLPLMFFATFIFGAGHGIVLPALQNLIISTAPEEQRAAIMTAFGSTIRVGQTIGPPLFAAIPTTMSFFMGAIIALFFFVAYSLIRNSKEF